MRTEEFRHWLNEYVAENKTGELSERTKNAYVRDNERLEIYDDFDLDIEFEKDGLETLLERYTYSLKDKRNMRENPTNLDIDISALYKSLGSHKTALNHYRKFRLDTP